MHLVEDGPYLRAFGLRFVRGGGGGWRMGDGEVTGVVDGAYFIYISIYLAT